MTLPDLSMFGTITLGELLHLLRRCDPGAVARFTFCYAVPTDLHSYRGYYDHLAFGWSTKKDAPTVGDLIARLEAAKTATFHGWKGGEYRMNDESPVWVDQPGESSGTAIVGVLNESESYVKLVTGYVP